jgi:hypothetical protein
MIKITTLQIYEINVLFKMIFLTKSAKRGNNVAIRDYFNTNPSKMLQPYREVWESTCNMVPSCESKCHHVSFESKEGWGKRSKNKVFNKIFEEWNQYVICTPLWSDLLLTTSLIECENIFPRR